MVVGRGSTLAVLRCEHDPGVKPLNENVSLSEEPKCQRAVLQTWEPGQTSLNACLA